MSNSKMFELTAQEKRAIKINLKMSYAITTRTAAQCHSHHQKMSLKYGSLEDIIFHFQHLLPMKKVLDK